MTSPIYRPDNDLFRLLRFMEEQIDRDFKAKAAHNSEGNYEKEN